VSSARSRRLLLIALVVLAGLVGSVGFLLKNRSRPFVRLELETYAAHNGLAFLDEETLATIDHIEGTPLSKVRLYSLAGGTARLVSTSTVEASRLVETHSSEGPLLESNPDHGVRFRSPRTLALVGTLPLGALAGTSGVVDVHPPFALVESWTPISSGVYHRSLDVCALATGALVASLELPTIDVLDRDWEKGNLVGARLGAQGDRIHVVVARKWIEWSIAEKRVLREREVPPVAQVNRDRGFLGLSDARELLLLSKDGLVACSPEGAARDRHLALNVALVPSSGPRVFVLESDGLSKRWGVLDTGSGRLVSGVDFELNPKGRSPSGAVRLAFSPSGERLAIVHDDWNDRGGVWETTLEVYALPP
jgi:hypothetical protein